MPKPTILLLIAFISFFTSCIPFDRVPAADIILDKSVLNEISGMNLQDTLADNKFKVGDFYEVSPDKYKYHLVFFASTFKIRIKWKDSTTFVSERFKFDHGRKTIALARINGNMVVKDISPPAYASWLKLFAAILISLMLFKVLPVFFIVFPERKWNFLLRLLGLNLLYLAICFLLFLISGGTIGVFLVFIYLIFLFADYIFLNVYYTDERGYLRVILATIISNAAFLTLGLGAISLTFIRFL